MATLANERHLRYILLLAEGGTDILLELLKRVTDTETQHSGKTVNDLLKDNERILKQWTDKKQREKIFPASGTPNINDWDISLLGTVILQLYGKWLTSNEWENIKKLKTLRNELAAHPPTLSMDAEQYETARKELSSILIQLSNTLDYRVHDRCQMLIKRVTTGPIDIQTALEWVKVDKMLLENMKRVSDRVEVIAGKVDILSNNDDVIKDLRHLLQQQQQKKSNEYSFPVLGSKMTLNGPDDSKTRLIEHLVTAAYEKALRRTRGNIEDVLLERAVMSIVKDIKQLDDSEVKIDNNCIRMTLKCKTSDGYLRLLQYFGGDVFIQSLLDLVLAAEDMSEGPFDISFEIERDSLEEMIHYIEKENKFPSVGKVRTIDRAGNVWGEKSGLHHDSDQISIEDENEALIDDIIELLDSEDCKTREVILLFGRSGAGKSALVNTIHKALSGKYFRIAKHGKGEISTVTMGLNGRVELFRIIRVVLYKFHAFLIVNRHHVNSISFEQFFDIDCA